MTAYKSYLNFLRFLALSLIFGVLLISRMYASVQDHPIAVTANDSASEQSGTPESHTPGKFNAGEMIMEHVLDNHEWHIAEIGSLKITIPLPVILLYEGRLYTFCSSRFHHETPASIGFTIETEGPQGKNYTG